MPSRTASETPAALPRSRRTQYSTLIPATSATSSRRRPATRRRPPKPGRPMAAGGGLGPLLGRDSQRGAGPVGPHDKLLTVALDITDPAASEAAAAAAVERFGRIDVLVNNAGNFYAGFFETLSVEQVRAQMETNFFGPLNVTRAILPILRRQGSGQI